MKRVPVLEDLNEWGRGEHPDAGKPLSAFQSITAVCDDCGHAAVLDRDALMAMSSVPTFAALWRHAYCAPCRAIGTAKTSVMLHGLLVERNPEPPQVKPKRVFTDDRSDPTPNLPRRSIFNRRGPASLERMI